MTNQQVVQQWAQAAVAAMLARVRAMTATEYERLIAELHVAHFE